MFELLNTNLKIIKHKTKLCKNEINKKILLQNPIQRNAYE